MSEERKSDWLFRCQAIGCCLRPSVIKDGHQLCTFHHGKEPGEDMRNWSAISDAIKENESLIKRAFGLMLKGTKFWADSKFYHSVMGWDFCPLKPNELPHMYTNKLLKKVERVIYETATENLERDRN